MPIGDVTTLSHKTKTISHNEDGFSGNMYAFNEDNHTRDALALSDFDKETKTFAVPLPEYSDPDWTPEPSKLTPQQVRDLVAEWLG